MMGKARYVAAAACAALLAAGAGACGTSVSVVTEGAAQGPTIAIGVAADQPGLGYLHGGEYSGFDIDVAKYVAKTLGYAEKQIVFNQLSPAMRASALTDGTVDMVVDSFSMDGTHDGEADVAGPYLTVREALLIRSDSASEITGTDSLSDKTVCAVAGSAADDNIRNRTKNIRTTVAERDTYPQCMTALMIGEADAVAAEAFRHSQCRDAPGNQSFPAIFTIEHRGHHIGDGLLRIIWTEIHRLLLEPSPV